MQVPLSKKWSKTYRSYFFPSCKYYRSKFLLCQENFSFQITGWLPLHEAAWKGFEYCCSALIAGGSPIRPRTPKNETPADLARANAHHELAARLEETQEKPPLSQEEAERAERGWWGSTTVSREEAVHAVTAAAPVGKDGGDGTFLIRGSRKGRHVFVLTLLHDRKTHHFEIVRQGVFYFLEEGPYLPSLAHLVRHYSRFADGLPCRLKTAVPCASATQPRPDAAPRVPPRDMRGAPYPSNLQSLDKRLRYENNESLRRVRHSRDAIPLESVSVGALIGEGEFGSVREGEYLDSDGNRRKVAVKRLNALEGSDAASSRQREEFMKEAALMMMLDHQCVVQLIGNFVSTKKNLTFSVAIFLPAAKPSGPRTVRVVGVGVDEIGIPSQRKFILPRY